jgi:hypothetical protein
VLLQGDFQHPADVFFVIYHQNSLCHGFHLLNRSCCALYEVRGLLSRVVFAAKAAGSLVCVSQCAVERHGLSVGSNPTRQLSLQPDAQRRRSLLRQSASRRQVRRVSNQSERGGNEADKASGEEGRLGRLGERAGRNVSER